MQCLQWVMNLLPFDLKSNTIPLSHHAPQHDQGGGGAENNENVSRQIEFVAVDRESMFGSL